MKTYAGIGARQTPAEVLDLMTRTAAFLQRRGYVLRSGGAAGADSAFEAGVTSHAKEIYLPWRGFNGNSSEFTYIKPAAYKLAEKYHPAWHRCSAAARKFHARNMYQVLGWELDDPCDFVLCWTPGAKPVGGTGQAIRVAEDLGIPVINMADEFYRFDLRVELG